MKKTSKRVVDIAGYEMRLRMGEDLAHRIGFHEAAAVLCEARRLADCWPLGAKLLHEFSGLVGIERSEEDYQVIDKEGRDDDRHALDFLLHCVEAALGAVEVKS